MIDADEDPLELSVGFYYKLDRTRFFKAEVFKELNNSSPDYGVMFGLVNWF